MKKEKFKIGDLVRVIEEHDGNEEIINKIGKIIAIDSDESLDIEFKVNIGGWGDYHNKWNVPFDKVVKYVDSIKKGDRVKLNKKQQSKILQKNYWNGCQLTTLGFIRKKANENEIFVVEEFYGDDCVDLISEESNEKYELVNINILEKTENDVKEMTIEEISKELGYKIKIKKGE